MDKAMIVLSCLALVAMAHDTPEKVPTVFGVFREDCYTKFQGGDFSDSSCIKFTFSKAIGFAIITGAFILKVPQILKIVGGKSAEGISPLSMYLETFNFINTAALSIHLGLPFDVYGETLVILVQNAIVIILIWQYSKVGAAEKVIFTVLALAYGYVLFEGSMVPEEIWALVSSSSIALNIASRIPQIFANFKASSTGQLAFVTTFLSWAGGAARLATVLFESDDFMYRL